jgi:hypothetical protein
MVRKALAVTGLATALALAAPAVQTQQTAQSLGTVQMPRAVRAGELTLPAGSYTVRVSSAAVPASVGLSSESSAWLEFVQGSDVRGRELAVVLNEAEVIEQVVDSAPPASGSAKVEVLRGNEYVRLWINRGGTHYLVHFPISAG